MRGLSTAQPNYFCSEDCALTVVTGEGDPMRYREADILIDKYVARFWAADKGPAAAPYPQSPDYKLFRFLLPTLAAVEQLPVSMQRWVDGKRDRTTVSIEKAYLASPIVLSDTIKKSFPEVPATAAQAYNKSAIADSVHQHLAENNDPSEYIVARYHEHRDMAEDERAKRIGDKALTLFLFAAGGRKFVKELASTTQEFYERELLIRQAMPASK